MNSSNPYKPSQVAASRGGVARRLFRKLRWVMLSSGILLLGAGALGFLTGIDWLGRTNVIRLDYVYTVFGGVVAMLIFLILSTNVRGKQNEDKPG